MKREGGPREGGPRAGDSRDFKRRDDGERSNDRPSFDRDRRNDSPRPANSDRFGSDRRSDERGSVNRRDSRDSGPRDERPRTNDRPSESRPPFDRDGVRKPRFERDDRRDSKPREGGFNRDNDRSDSPPRTSGSSEESSNRFGNERRFEDRRDAGPRDAGPTDERPRENDRRDERPRENRYGDKPKFDRGPSSRSDDRPRQDRPERIAAPRDEEPRDSDRPDVADKPRDNEFDKRFSSEQREDSRGRQVGKFKRAPDYNRGTFAKPDFNKKDSDKKTPGNRFEKPRAERNAGPRTETPRNPSAPDQEDHDAAGLMRLNRYIANAGVCSRREADELIGRGDIMVNGKVVVEMGYKVQETDIVKYGKTTLNPEKLIYVLLNKPKDYLTTTEDPEERRTVMELVADAGNYRIYPVGRLDRNTTGLLLMTNDGELADKLTHPSNNVRKIYQAELDKPMTADDFETLRAGIELEDGLIKPDDLALVTPDGFVVGIEIHSGRNRIVRRIFEHLGYEVTKLDRTIYAGLSKKELPRGKWRFLEPKEVIKLKYLN